MGLLSRFNKPDSSKIHSSGIAAANDGSARALGAMRNETFSQRRTVEQNRQHIGSYRESTLAQASQHPQSTLRTGESAPVSGSATTPRATSRIDIVKPSRQQMNAQMVSRPSISRANFSEPHARGFNPYS